MLCVLLCSWSEHFKMLVRWTHPWIAKCLCWMTVNDRKDSMTEYALYIRMHPDVILLTKVVYCHREHQTWWCWLCVLPYQEAYTNKSLYNSDALSSHILWRLNNDCCILHMTGTSIMYWGSSFFLACLLPSFLSTLKQEGTQPGKKKKKTGKKNYSAPSFGINFKPSMQG